MHTIICEGKYDCIFLNEIYEIYYNNSNNNPLSIYKNKISKLQRALLGREYDYIKRVFGIIIYEDNGKTVIKNMVLPRILRDCFGKRSEILTFVVLLDGDGQDKKECVEQIFKKLSTIFQNVKNCSIKKTSIDSIELVSDVNDDYKILIEIMIVPESLEIKLRDIYLKKNNTLFSLKKRKELITLDPHDALNLIGEILGEDMEFIFRNPVNQRWLDKEQWYKFILNDLPH